MPASPSMIRFGTDEPVADPRILRAGVLEARLDGGNLRTIKIGGVEAIRGIAFLARDADWGTYNATIEALAVEERPDGFTVTYRAHVGDAEQGLTYTAHIEGRADGALTFSAEGAATSDFVTNRTGFVVLHPLVGVVGEPVAVEHTDGTVEESHFPRQVDPACPFQDIRALTHEILPGVSLSCRMEGDAYEMEDHRNWLDASFKTYIRPLAKPRPYTMAKGERFVQSVTLMLSGTVRDGAAGGSEAARVSLGGPTGTAVPRLGVAVPAEWVEEALGQAELVAAAGPAFLVCHFDARQGHDAGTVALYAALGEAVGVPLVLEAVVPCEDGEGRPSADPAILTRDMGRIAEACRGVVFERVAVSPAADLKSTLPGETFPPAPTWEALAEAARAAFPDVPVGGGMFSYFTELNRKRPPRDLFDFVVHSGSPIVHAGDDDSVMENLQSLPSVFHSVRAFMGETPHWVFPLAISMRMNPYGAAPADNPENIRQAMNRTDPRDRALLGAAWYVAFAAEAARAGIAAMTLAAAAGPSGIVATPAERDESDGEAAVAPSWHVVRAFAALGGRAVLEAHTDQPDKVAAMAAAEGDRVALILVNLTGAPVDVEVDGLGGPASGWVLDETTFGSACRAPREDREIGISLPVRLQPYATISLRARRG